MHVCTRNNCRNWPNAYFLLCTVQFPLRFGGLFLDRRGATWRSDAEPQLWEMALQAPGSGPGSGWRPGTRTRCRILRWLIRDPNVAWFQYRLRISARSHIMEHLWLAASALLMRRRCFIISFNYIVLGDCELL